MPERFDSDVYPPEVAKLMKEAFEAAWPKVALIGKNRELTRQLLASAIIDEVNAGMQDRDRIVAGAMAAMAVAQNVSRSVE
jgi:hypothetical protein